MADIFERPNKKPEEVRQQEEKESEYLKTIGEQKVELDYLKKSTGNFTEQSLLRGSNRSSLQSPEHFTSVQDAWDFTEPVLLRAEFTAG